MKRVVSLGKQMVSHKRKNEYLLKNSQINPSYLLKNNYLCKSNKHLLFRDCDESQTIKPRFPKERGSF